MAARPSLKETLIQCQPFKDGAGTIVCIGCFKLLAFPAGAKKLRCAFCQTITSGIKIRCTACNEQIHAAMGVSQVKCPHCSYSFRPMATLRIKPPEWADNQKVLETSLTVKIDSSVSAARVSEFQTKVNPTQPLRTSSTSWEEQTGADFRSVAFYKGDHMLDPLKTPMALELKDGDVIEIRRVVKSSTTGHEFVSSQFGQPTNCAYCKDFIWGIYHQGKKCAKCRLPVHHRCADKSTGMCEADRRNLFGVVNFNDSDDEGDPDVVTGVVISDEDKINFSSCVEEAVEPECDPNFMQGLSKISNFSDQEIQDIWAHYDADGSGTLEMDEMKKFMSDLVGQGGGSWSKTDSNIEEAVDRMMKRMDTNNDGVIQWEEFWYFYKAQQDAKYLEQFNNVKLGTDELYQLWYHYDSDNSGTLETDEVLQLLADIAQQNKGVADKFKWRFESMLAPDAKVTWEQFCTMIVPVVKSALKK